MEIRQVESNDTLLKNFVIELAAKLQNNKIHIDEDKGVATIQGTKDGKIFSFSIEQKDYSVDESKNIPDKFIRKADYKNEVRRLYQSGMKQIEIARKLNMSQSSVSKLLNDEYWGDVNAKYRH